MEPSKGIDSSAVGAPFDGSVTHIKVAPLVNPKDTKESNIFRPPLGSGECIDFQPQSKAVVDLPVRDEFQKWNKACICLAHRRRALSQPNFSVSDFPGESSPKCETIVFNESIAISQTIGIKHVTSRRRYSGRKGHLLKICRLRKCSQIPRR